MNKRVVGQINRASSKPITTSVPSFTFRFNAEDEELELSQTVEPDVEENQEEEANVSPISTPQNVASLSRDHSPMKEQKLSKRSASLDEGPGSSDTWRILHELKGKITKTVEEKLSEIKSDKKKDHPSKLMSSKDNSSISDSEECTGAEKTPQDDGSPVLASPESSTPEPEQAETPRVEVSPPTDTEASPQKSFFKVTEIKNRIRPKLSELRQRRKKSVNTEVTGISMSELHDEHGDEVAYEEEVESAVEVQELEASEQAISPIKKKNEEAWSFTSHLRQLLKQREIQALIVWPLFCLLLPIPSVVRDLILGALLMHTLHCVYNWLLEPGSTALEKPLHIPDYSSLPILQVPAAHEHQPLQKYEGWMNELPDDYDPETYHINQTRSVFLILEGSTLKVCLTRQKVRKRAMWNEPPPRLSFHHQRIFDISGCPIKLLPEGLARKRLWSKKYPICVVLRQDSRVGFSVPETFKDAIEEDEDVEEDVLDENSEDDAFCMVTSSMVEQNQLYLFARTDREKDDWVRRLVAATKRTSSPDDVSNPQTPLQENEEASETCCTPEPPVASPEMELHRHISRFLQQVQKCLARKSQSKDPQTSTPAVVNEQESPSDSPTKCNKSEEENKPDTAWFNALLSRVLFDVLRDRQWSDWVRDRIQRKLATIKLPTFMEELTVSELDLGVALPVVHRTSAPHMDERGLWVDLDVSYEGSAHISVATKLNLVKLTKADSLESSSSSNRDVPPVDSKDLRSPMFDSDMEDSAESSSDEDTQEASADDSAQGSSSSGMGKMFIRMATKITTSRYFQQASEISYIRRAMEEMSNTKVMVTVELKGLVGVLALNIPPPPSDRLWYGFRGNPQLRLAAKAKLGERLVTLSQVTDFIEGKLCLEFQKVFVLPNMDDIIIPVMNGKIPK